MELSSIGGFAIKRHHNQNIKCGGFCGSLVKRGKKQKTANSSRISGLFVVPPGIVINTQAALYLHFKESQTPQSPPIAPPQNAPFCAHGSG